MAVTAILKRIQKSLDALVTLLHARETLEAFCFSDHYHAFSKIMTDVCAFNGDEDTETEKVTERESAIDTDREKKDRARC